MRASADHGAAGVQNLVGALTGIGEVHGQRTACPRAGAVATDRGQQTAAGVGGARTGIHRAIAGADAHEDVAAGQGIGYQLPGGDLHLSLALVTGVADTAAGEQEGGVSIVVSAEEVAATAVLGIGQRQQALLDGLQLADDGLQVAALGHRAVGLDAQLDRARHQVVDLRQRVLLHAEAVLDVVGVLAQLLQPGDDTIQADRSAGRDRVVLGGDDLAPGGDLVLQMVQLGLLGQHQRNRLVEHHAGGDAVVHERTAPRIVWNMVSAVEISCDAAW